MCFGTKKKPRRGAHANVPRPKHPKHHPGATKLTGHTTAHQATKDFRGKHSKTGTRDYHNTTNINYKRMQFPPGHSLHVPATHRPHPPRTSSLPKSVKGGKGVLSGYHHSSNYPPMFRESYDKKPLPSLPSVKSKSLPPPQKKKSSSTSSYASYGGPPPDLPSVFTTFGVGGDMKGRNSGHPPALPPLPLKPHKSTEVKRVEASFKPLDNIGGYRGVKSVKGSIIGGAGYGGYGGGRYEGAAFIEEQMRGSLWGRGPELGLGEGRGF